MENDETDIEEESGFEIISSSDEGIEIISCSDEEDFCTSGYCSPMQDSMFESFNCSFASNDVILNVENCLAECNKFDNISIDLEDVTPNPELQMVAFKGSQFNTFLSDEKNSAETESKENEIFLNTRRQESFCTIDHSNLVIAVNKISAFEAEKYSPFLRNMLNIAGDMQTFGSSQQDSLESTECLVEKGTENYLMSVFANLNHASNEACRQFLQNKIEVLESNDSTENSITDTRGGKKNCTVTMPCFSSNMYLCDENKNIDSTSQQYPKYSNVSHVNMLNIAGDMQAFGSSQQDSLESTECLVEKGTENYLMSVFANLNHTSNEACRQFLQNKIEVLESNDSTENSITDTRGGKKNCTATMPCFSSNIYLCDEDKNIDSTSQQYPKYLNVSQANSSQDVSKESCTVLQNSAISIPVVTVTPRTNISEEFVRQNTDANTNVKYSMSSDNWMPHTIPRYTSIPRNNSCLEICSVLKQSKKFYSWLCRNEHVRYWINEAKISFNNVLNIFDNNSKQNLEHSVLLKVVVVADKKEYMAIKDSLHKTCKGHIRITQAPESSNSKVPVLPIGYNSALYAAQHKIYLARQQLHFDTESIVISTATFVDETTPQRWQMSTLIYLEDNSMGLNLHNFSTTVPVPNEYILEAQRKTPEDYLWKYKGFAVDIKEAIGATTMRGAADIQQLLSGVSQYEVLKQTMNVLAGMFKKYARRTVYYY